MDKKTNLPKFLIADNSQEEPDSIFVLHTQKPKFLVKFNLDDFEAKPDFFWFDEKPKDDAEIANFQKLAFNFFIEEMEHQDSFDI